jgi:hypothetical protein
MASSTVETNKRMMARSDMRFLTNFMIPSMIFSLPLIVTEIFFLFQPAGKLVQALCS